jgi:hypothetical protein
MLSNSSNNAEYNLSSDIDKNKQTKSKSKLILFKYYSINSRYKIHNNYQINFKVAVMLFPSQETLRVNVLAEISW